MDAFMDASVDFPSGLENVLLIFAKEAEAQAFRYLSSEDKRLQNIGAGILRSTMMIGICSGSCIINGHVLNTLASLGTPNAAAVIVKYLNLMVDESAALTIVKQILQICNSGNGDKDLVMAVVDGLYDIRTNLYSIINERYQGSMQELLQGILRLVMTVLGRSMDSPKTREKAVFIMVLLVRDFLRQCPVVQLQWCGSMMLGVDVFQGVVPSILKWNPESSDVIVELMTMLLLLRPCLVNTWISAGVGPQMAYQWCHCSPARVLAYPELYPYVAKIMHCDSSIVNSFFRGGMTQEMYDSFVGSFSTSIKQFDLPGCFVPYMTH